MSSELRVGDIMTKKVVVVPFGESIIEVAKLMKKHDIGSIIVVENDEKMHAKGIITERDIVHKLLVRGKDMASVKVEDAMSKPLRVVTTDASLEHAAKAMKENNIKRLGVLNDKHEFVGIISEGDIMRIFPAIVDLLEERMALSR